LEIIVRPLRDLLVDRVGAEMAALGPRDLAAAGGAEVRYLAEVLAFLTDHGWRPAGAGGWDLCRLWEYLAGHTADAGERRRLLVAALGAAEAFADVRRIRARLAESGGVTGAGSRRRRVVRLTLRFPYPACQSERPFC
jgi:hypothetical protein